MKRKMPVCPYCKDQLDFLQAFQIKTHREYVCDNCLKVSHVIFSDRIRDLAKILYIMIAIVITLFSLFIRSYLWGTILILALFAAFYAQVPNFVELKKNSSE